jgi:hypothetical protein
VAWSRDVIHRSSGRPGAGDEASADGSISLAFAYSTKKEKVFHSVRSIRRTPSSIASGDTRRADHGDPETTKNHRSASAP